MSVTVQWGQSERNQSTSLQQISLLAGEGGTSTYDVCDLSITKGSPADLIICYIEIICLKVYVRESRLY